METRAVAVHERTRISWGAWIAAAAATLVAASLVALLVPRECPVRLTPYALGAMLFIKPVLEEAAFRGGLQTLMLARLPRHIGLFGVSLANVLTSLAFGAVHVYFGSWPSAVMVLPSLVLGAVYERCGRLWPVILLHMAFNSALMLVCTSR